MLENKTVECVYCNASIGGIDALKFHQSHDHVIFNCLICRATITGDEKIHMKKTHSSCRSCKAPGKSFDEIFKCEEIHRSLRSNFSLCLKNYSKSYCSLSENTFFRQVNEESRQIKFELNRSIPTTQTGNISVLNNNEMHDFRS